MALLAIGSSACGRPPALQASDARPARAARTDELGKVFLRVAPLSPDIWYFKDTDSDGRANLRKMVCTGFHVGHAEDAPNTLHWGPDDILKRVDVTSGHDRGRIWRIAPEGFRRPAAPRLGSADTAGLVAALNHADAWPRETAQRLLVERRDLASAAPAWGRRSPPAGPAAAPPCAPKSPRPSSAARNASLPGDAARGREVFLKNCANCHRLGADGVEVGPHPLGRDPSVPTLLASLLDPNRDIQPNYVAYVVTTKDETTFTGLLASETATSVTLRRAGGEKDTLFRQDIASLASTRKSLMPEGLDALIDPLAMANLIRFLQQAGRPDGAR